MTVDTGAIINRRYVLWASILLAALATILPMLGIAIYARAQSIEGERRHLQDYGRWTLKRASLSVDAAVETMNRLTAERWEACSAEHIERMRQLVIDTRSIDGIGYLVDGRLACTSWGKTAEDVVVGAPDSLLSGGVGLHLNTLSRATGSGSTLSLSRDNYVIFIHRDRLVDVLTDEPIVLGISTREGLLIALSTGGGGSGSAVVPGQGETAESAGDIRASVRNADFEAFGIASRSQIGRRLTRQLWLFAPIGIILSLFLIALIVWVSRQRMASRYELQIALRRNEFVALYQPIIELSTGRCVGAEALARWHRPGGPVISPDIFVPLAEANNLIEPLTERIIRCVVDDLGPVLRQNRSAHISINLASADMDRGSFLQVLEHVLPEGDIAPSQIWLEVTERSFIDTDKARLTLEKARAAGHLIAIDDFGTGYSNLSLLEALPLDKLKVDKSFVDAIGQDAITSVVVAHIISMARSLGLAIVAEGVETREQESYLLEAGVRYAQGWLYSRPLTAKQFADFLASGPSVAPEAKIQ